MKIKNNRRAFTIVELVIVIAVIAILASVLIPTFSNVIDKANRSSAMQEAKNAWSEVSYTYTAGYKGFAADCGCMNGWYYDYVDEVAKYDVDEKYTVYYDGENWTVNDLDEDSWKWDAITTASADYTTYSLTTAPASLNITFYTDIYSRGFAWMTDTTNNASELYIVESNKGEEADFSGANAINGTCEQITYSGGTGNQYSGISSTNYNRNAGSGSDIGTLTYNSHKAYKTGLSASTTYSYKVGGNGSYEYGTFRTASSSITSITAIQLSDAQTLNPGSLNVWENTMAQAIETAGHSLDMILYNGDQFDQRMWSSDNSGTASSLTRILRYGLARDTVDEYVGTIPYMTSSGNHEPFAPYSQTLTSAIDYGVDGTDGDGVAWNGGYYSYDYGFAHFVVLNSNGDFDAQATWLEDDLAKASSAKWIIVMIHFGPYATGDHLSGSKTLNDAFTSIFAEYKVDLVLQAHDHTYNKTLPYSWGTGKGQVSKTASAEEIANVINQNVTTTTYNGETYDLNPNGTYYVTTGAAGHRVGEDGDTYVKNYENNSPYKLICGTISVDSDYGNIGDEASTNLSVQMFGVLNLTETTLTYDFYTVDGNEVKLFDSLNVMKN